MMRWIIYAILGVIAALSIMFGAGEASAQPCQWNYSMQPGSPDPNQGTATATYCGNAEIQGNLVVNGTINVQSGAISPEQFGARGDGTCAQDDQPAIQAAIDYALAHPSVTAVIGNGYYCIASTFDISNFASNFTLHLGKLQVAGSWPTPSNWKLGTPMFTVGASGGSQVGLKVDIGYINGSNKADVVHIINNGVGGSKFNFQYITNTNVNVSYANTTFNTASNYFTGGYWNIGKAAARVMGGSPGVAEGTTFDVNFIALYDYGGIILYDGSQYANVRGQLDFNGQWVTRVAVFSNAGWNIGDTLTDTTNGSTGEVLAVYNSQGSQFLIVAETKNTSGGTSNFNVLDNITNGTASTQVSGTMVSNAGGTSGFYFDIIQAYTSAALFARNTIITPYLGGIIGSYLYTNFIQSANSAYSTTNQNQGLMVTNNGAGQLSLYNTYLSSSTPFLDTTATLMAPQRTLYMNTFGVYGNVFGATLPNGVPTVITTLPAAGVNGGVWDIAITSPADAAISARCTAFIDLTNVSNRIPCYGASNISVSISGLNISATQSTGSPRSVVLTATLITTN